MNDRFSNAMLDFQDTSNTLITTLIGVIPPELVGEPEVQEAMKSYIIGAAKFQTDAAVFVAQRRAKEVSNG